MLALFTVFEHLTNLRRLLNRFHLRYTTPTHVATVSTTSTKSDDHISSDLISDTTDQQRDILLGPVLNNILSDNRLKYFDDEFQHDLQDQDYFARELDACLLEMREIERDIVDFKQRQCYFYERYLDFVDKKDQLIDNFVEYYDEYLLNNPNQPLSPTKKQLRKKSMKYEFSVPVTNRFALLKRQHTENFE